MREVRASDAKTHLPQLLKEVERGETLIITRHGRAIARIVPETDRRREGINAAVASIQLRRRRMGRTTFQEIKSARDEGKR